MIVCPHCGAENADSSGFCSLCLARFSAQSPSVEAPQPAAEDGIYPGSGYQTTQTYVAPGDYRSLAQEMSRQPQQSSVRGSAYYGAAMQNPDAVSSLRLPALTPHKSRLDIAIMLLSYSLLTFFVLFMCRFLVGIILLGAAFGGSEAGFSIGVAMLFVSDALVLAVGGYMISAKAMHQDRGWLFGAGCAACAIFIWQPLASLILVLVLTGEVYLPLFTLAGILFTLFLELPMGALGGWIAEKRLMG